jgi:hypothetical protein
MSTMRDDDFEKWTSQWEKAMADDIFASAPSPPVPDIQTEPDFFGNYKPREHQTDIKDADTEYWRRVYNLSRHAGDSPDPLEELQPINEVEELVKSPRSAEFKLVQTSVPDGKTVAQITDDLGKLPNPVTWPTRERDAKKSVTPNWAGGEEIQELQAMKMNLEKLESKLNAAEGMGDIKKMKGLMEKLSSLRKQFEEFSNDITPEFRSEYLS